MTLTSDHYRKFSSDELKVKINSYGGALATGGLSEEAYEAMHTYVNEMIDILKERNDL